LSLGVSRIGDVCSGHGNFRSRPCLTGSSNVFANGIGVASIGDIYDVHCDSETCHMGIIVSGSSSVFVNGRPIARVGDMIDCGSVILTSSNNVFSG
jgi:uncharacterized Zn-binding protein involved in type VI secretion